MYEGCDMIASLYRLPEATGVEGVGIKRAFAGEKHRVIGFIREHFEENWAGEAEYAMMQAPGKCFIATRDGEIVGFACYDASAKGFFGPIGVIESARGMGVGRALLIRTLRAMRECGYGYAIIGWVNDAAPFYRKTVGAVFIPGGDPEHSVYSNMIGL